jgi:HEAT repeat protein
VTEGLETTLQLLKTTSNEAAMRVLIPALDSPSAVIREGALSAILSRRDPAGHGEVLRRLHVLDAQSRAIVEARRERMTQAIRDAVLSGNLNLCANGCAAAVWFREYDLIPALLTVLEDPSSPKGELAGRTLTELAGRLYGELAGPVRGDGRRAPEQVRRQVIGALERSMKTFSRHRRREVLQAYLLLVHRDSAGLKQVLDDPHHAAFLMLVDVLSTSQAAGVIGLLLAFLDNPRAPSSVLSVIAKRCDLKVLQYLLRKIGREPSSAVRQNLKRIESVPWLKDAAAVLQPLDDLAQHAAVRLAVTSAIPRSQAFSVVKSLLLHGKRGGRRAAAEALHEFHGAEANALVLQALDDEDPQVQAKALVQLRRRGILGALPRLVEKVDSHHPVVRRAARTSLDEFSFDRFLAAFDMLDDEVRRSTGTLVKKVDPETVPRLKAELQAKGRARRLRALAVARVVGAVRPLETTITGLLHDDDHMVRTEAARALGQGTLVSSWAALEEALRDPSTTVRQAAQESLRHRIPPAREAEPQPDPRT